MSRETISKTQSRSQSRALRELIAAGDGEGLEAFCQDTPGDELTHAVASLKQEERGALMGLVPSKVATEILGLLPDVQGVDAVGAVPPELAADIVHELPSDEAADLVAALPNSEEVLDHLGDTEAAGLRVLAEYPEASAGGLMVTEFLAVPHDISVSEVVRTLRGEADDHRDYALQYVYVLDRSERLVGVLRLRDLLLTPGGRPAAEIMIQSPLAVPVSADLEALQGFFSENAFLGVPVLDEEGRLIGVVLRTAVEEALSARSEEVYRRAQGIVGGEELRSMPLLLRSRRRLSWLTLNIGLNVVAASVIAAHQDTIEAVIALAVFLPIISDMSGCSGNQAVAVSMRELSLKVTVPGDLFRVLWKEVQMGLVNGAVLAVLLGGAAWVWKGNPWLGIVVGGAIGVNTVVAVAIGGVIPLLLKRLKFDPALASGPILTTVTDLCGFLVLLSLASAVLSHLI